jgi:hypothetical protein
MPDLRREILKLRDPSAIRGALLASSPYVLRRAFLEDPTIRGLVAAGPAVVPLVAAQLRGTARLDEITLSALAFVIEQVQLEAAPEALGPRFAQAAQQPGAFFVHFAAHALRLAYHLPVKPLEMYYAGPELAEIRARLR